ncbi:hypothetical protein ACFLWN_03165 [Chloroflexota bacterium]
MVTALKITMIIIGVIAILMGLSNIFLPDQVAKIHGIAESASYSKWLAAIIGVFFIAVGVWVVTAGRDPLNHIYWVKFVITLFSLGLLVNIYAIIRGYVSFNQIGAHIIMDAIFVAALLAFYPWRLALRGK